MKRLFSFMFIVLAMVSCAPEDAPVNDDEGTDVETPVNPDPDPVPDPGPAPEPGVFESSFEAVANMGVGWNLGNTLESVWTGNTDGRAWEEWETGWGQAVTTPELMTMMKNAGFGAIRVPVSWGVHMDSDGNVYPEWMNRVQEVVDYVLDAGMYCIINVHHDTGADEELAWLVASSEVYSKEKSRYEGLWRQIAERFRDYDQRLLFESYNEMLDSGRSWCFASMSLGYDAYVAADAYDAINDYAQSFVDVVRSTGGNNAVRNLVVNTYGACNGAGNWNPHLLDPLKNMKMPSDEAEEHVIFQVHSYPEIDNLDAMKAEVTAMLDALETHLVSLGGPVIVGEWGTFSDNPPLENYCHYAGWFVSEAKRRGIGTFHWMGLSDGVFRSIPCFSQPEITEAIVKGYHGDGFTPVIPVAEEFDMAYRVVYRDLWSEANLCSSVLNLSDYKGISFNLAEVPAKGALQVKVYGDEDGKEQYAGIDGTAVSVSFDKSVLGSKVNRVTLQCMVSGGLDVLLNDVTLIRSDGTEEECVPSVFWGCSVDLF